MSAFYLSQCLITVAFCTDLLSFQLKERKQILICLILSSIFIAAHFFVLDKTTATLIVLVSTARFVTSLFTTADKFMLLFMLLSTFLFLTTYTEAVSVLAYIGSISATWAAFQSNDKQVRIGMMVCTVFWIVHNFIIASPAAMLLEIFFLSSNLIGYYRFYIRNVHI